MSTNNVKEEETAMASSETMKDCTSNVDDNAKMAMAASRRGNLVECHSLPCSIKYDGMAQVAIHFQPESHQLQRPNQNEANKVYYTAQFRGRGLIAQEPERTSPSHDGTEAATSNPLLLQGRVLSLGSIQQKKVQLQEFFDCLYEWQHSHQEAAVTNQLPSRVQNANDWYQVAQAVRESCCCVFEKEV